VLFLFVVMMLDINLLQMREGFIRYLPVGAVVALILLAELLVMLGSWVMVPEVAPSAIAATPAPETLTNTHALGQLLYTHYIYLFQVAGLILLVAMIGAIVLTHRRREGVRRQKVSDQIRRRAEETVELRKVPTGKGI
jgi:NADH-quinone oxidoreductase subunit J